MRYLKEKKIGFGAFDKLHEEILFLEFQFIYNIIDIHYTRNSY